MPAVETLYERGVQEYLVCFSFRFGPHVGGSHHTLYCLNFVAMLVNIVIRCVLSCAFGNACIITSFGSKEIYSAY